MNARTGISREKSALTNIARKGRNYKKRTINSCTYLDIELDYVYYANMPRSFLKGG
jgi:hypothetical protein